MVGSNDKINLLENQNEAQIFSEGLLHMNYNRVCILHNGIEAFRSLAGAVDDLLVVPNI